MTLSDTQTFTIDRNEIASFCQRNHIKDLSLFGSATRNDFGPDSDVNVLVEFEPDAEIDLIQFSGMRLELMELFGREESIFNDRYKTLNDGRT